MDFLHYITESNEHGLPEECDERLRRLHESIQEIKTSTSVEVEYMKMEERERLVKEEAIERGLREGRIRGREEGRMKLLFSIYTPNSSYNFLRYSKSSNALILSS